MAFTGREGWQWWWWWCVVSGGGGEEYQFEQILIAHHDSKYANHRKRSADIRCPYCADKSQNQLGRRNSFKFAAWRALEEIEDHCGCLHFTVPVTVAWGEQSPDI